MAKKRPARNTNTRSFSLFEDRLKAAALFNEVRKRSLARHVSLLELYEGPTQAPSIIAARRDVYLWLMSEGKGLNEVARLFDRAPNGISKLTRGETK